MILRATLGLKREDKYASSTLARIGLRSDEEFQEILMGLAHFVADDHSVVQREDESLSFFEFDSCLSQIHHSQEIRDNFSKCML